MSENNPYKPPESEVADIYSSSDAGGTLEKGIAGEYDFNIMDIVKEAWQRTKGIKTAYWLGLLMFLLVVISVTLLMTGFGFFGTQTNPLVPMAANLVFTAVTYPFLTGIIMMGVHRSVGLPVFAGQVFSAMGFLLPIVVASILVYLLTTAGFLLMILPGLYLSVAYFLVMPLIAEKHLGAWAAMEASRKAITHRWFKVFGLFLVMTAILVISALSVIGLFWALPMSTVMMGVLYRIIFGVEQARGDRKGEIVA